MVIFGFEFKDLENSAVLKEERFVSQMINVSKRSLFGFLVGRGYKSRNEQSNGDLTLHACMPNNTGPPGGGRSLQLVGTVS